jgi:hypothetical protein
LTWASRERGQRSDSPWRELLGSWWGLWFWVCVFCVNHQSLGTERKLLDKERAKRWAIVDEKSFPVNGNWKIPVISQGKESPI